MRLLPYAVLGVLLSLGVSASAAEAPDYSIRHLLEPCVEGDNDSRWGAAAEAECEQYIRGFVDAVLLLDASKAACLPALNREDEVRWAFMKWAHRHYDQRDRAAAEGLMSTLKESFACP